MAEFIPMEISKDAISITGDFNVAGNSVLSGDLEVNGNITHASGIINIGGNVDITGTIDVSGLATLGSISTGEIDALDDITTASGVYCASATATGNVNASGIIAHDIDCDGNIEGATITQNGNTVWDDNNLPNPVEHDGSGNITLAGDLDVGSNIVTYDEYNIGDQAGNFTFDGTNGHIQKVAMVSSATVSIALSNLTIGSYILNVAVAGARTVSFTAGTEVDSVILMYGETSYSIDSGAYGVFSINVTSRVSGADIAAFVGFTQYNT